MRIPDHIIDDIRTATDIVDIVGASVKLKKRGKNFLGLCPFHTEKTPSFTVSGEKQMYHCFGCGKGGNVFTFMMETEKVSFTEAVRTLADRAGIQIPEEGRSPTAQETESERLFNLTRFAGRLFHEHVYQTEEGKFALEYFHKRGFTDETITAFGLGYSLNTWDSFVQKATSEGFSAEDLVKTGLARKRDDGSLYDYFRGRAMFPIVQTSGRVLGFGARKIREDDPIDGKYINSPETPIYNKSRILYGLSHGKDAIRQEEHAFMVEGYADLISLAQAGIRNVVASSGTALTEEQLQLLSRYTQNLVLVYDADAAGSNATMRGIDLALEKNFDVRVISLPEGEDPDSFVQKFGGKKFREFAQAAQSFILYKAARLQAEPSFLQPEGKTAAIRSIVESVAKIPDELKRTVFVKDVAGRFDLPETVMYRELEKLRGSARPARSTFAESTEQKRTTDAAPVAEAMPVATGPLAPEERDILKLALEGRGDVLEYIFTNVVVEDLADERTRVLLQVIADVAQAHGEVDGQVVLGMLEDGPLKNLVTDLLMSKYELSPGWKDIEKRIDGPDSMRMATDAVRSLRRKSIHRALEENKRALKSASMDGAEVTQFLQRQQELSRSLRDLEAKSK